MLIMCAVIVRYFSTGAAGILVVITSIIIILAIIFYKYKKVYKGKLLTAY